MVKRRGIKWALLFVAIVGGLAWLWSSIKSEPAYQGKPLSLWLAELDKEMPPSNFSSRSGPAATAIQHIGTNAIPYLRGMLKVKDSRLKTALIDFSGNHKWAKIHLTPADILHRRAASAAFCLGAAGSPLMPDIIKMFRSTSYPEAFAVTETLGRIGYCNPETISALLAALDEPPNASPDFHGRAAFAFAQLHDCMEIVNADHPDAFHEPGYQAAVPALLKALNASNDVPLCLGATLKPYCATILKRIDPEAAAKVGVN